jgi:hypothetical protein
MDESLPMLNIIRLTTKTIINQFSSMFILDNVLYIYLDFYDCYLCERNWFLSNQSLLQYYLITDIY